MFSVKPIWRILFVVSIPPNILCKEGGSLEGRVHESVAVVVQYVMRMRRTVICGLSGCTILFSIILYMA